MHTLLFLLDRYPAYGGIEIVTTILANELANHYRIIICSVSGENGHEILQRLSPRIKFCMLPHARKRDIIAALDAILIREGVDIVIYQDSYAPNEYLAHHIARRGGVKLIVAEHNSPSLSIRWISRLHSLPWWNVYQRLKHVYFGSKGHLRAILRRTGLYRVCDRYVVLSESLKPEFVQHSFVRDTEKLCAISNPVTYPPLEHVPANKKKQVLFVGQFVNTKGIDRLLRIWGKVQDKAQDWSLVLVGDGPQMDATRKQIATQNLQRVLLEGYRSNINTYCEQASIFCLCSTFEGFGLVIVEAMCGGAVPICYHSFATLSDIITDGVDGYSIPAFDEDAFSARLLALMQDEKMRRRMAEAALKKTEIFSLRTISSTWVELLDQLTAQCPR